MGKVPREGDLHKELEVFGERFSLYYGYYEECDRRNPHVEPVPIYPDLRAAPIYTKEGRPFVTMMQDVCLHFAGERNVDSDCGACAHYRHGEELLGICLCERNRKNE